MERRASEQTIGRARLLSFCGVLHAFTHSFHVVLMPLYIPMQRDLQLESVGQSTFLMSVLMMSYFLPSYLIGVWADRYDRRKLLGWGLVINGAGFLILGWAPNFGWALFGCGVAGFGGSFYHPAATALIADLYPDGQGRAFGLVGIGANVGLLGAPIYSGWRTEALAAQVGDAAWRQPILELGALSVVVALIFLVATRGRRYIGHRTTMENPGPVFPSVKIWGLFLLAGLALSCRDFAGMSVGSLGSLFLQEGHGFTTRETGLALSAIFVAAIVSNPLFGKLSDRHRYPWTVFVMVMAGLCVMAYPYLPKAGLVWGLVAYGFFFMACYPMTEAALMENIPAAARGRVFGFFLMFSGVVGNLSHGWVGAWVERLGAEAANPLAYRGVYFLLGCLIWVSILGLLCLWWIRRCGPNPNGKVPT